MVVHHERRYPTGPKIALPVRYVEMIDERDQLYCMFPDFAEFLYIPEPGLLKSMLSETVRSLTATLTPRAVHRLWPPQASSLRWLRLTLAEPGSYQSVQTCKVLRGVAEPLTDRRSLAMPGSARDAELALLRTAMAHGSCLVVGETGVGKSTLIACAAREMQQQRRDEFRRSRRRPDQPAPATMFWTSSGGRLIAGMRYLGQWQQRLEAVVEELSNIDGVLVIENLLDLVSVGGAEPRDSLAAFLLPYIRSGSLRLVAEATQAEWDACRRLLPALADAMVMIPLPPLASQPERELIRVTLGNRLQSTGIEFDQALPDTISRVCRQYQSHNAPPGPAMRFVEELTSRRRDHSLPKRLTVAWVLERFSKRSGLPLILLDDAQPLQHQQVVAQLEHSVIGQNAACTQVASLITKVKSAVQDPRRPFGCMLFCGPTGVGKTQLAKSLAQYLFGATGHGLPLIRMDMSEFGGAAAGYRFLQDAEGNPARWIQRVRSHPLSVVLLDEIEKASHEVFDILLSTLDEGRLTDRLGRVTSFRNSVILMTSNIGARVSTLPGFGGLPRVDYVAEVRKAFRPEFFNRLDSVIPFEPLTRETMRRITEKELGELRQREGLERYGRSIQWTSALVEHLTQVGFASDLGARPLQRVIESEVVARLSRALVQMQPNQSSGPFSIQLGYSSKRITVEINST